MLCLIFSTILLLLSCRLRDYAIFIRTSDKTAVRNKRKANTEQNRNARGSRFDGTSLVLRRLRYYKLSNADETL